MLAYPKFGLEDVLHLNERKLSECLGLYSRVKPEITAHSSSVIPFALVC